MSENVTASEGAAAPSNESAPEASTEEITYHAVEKDGVVTAIWEMQGRKHLRTIDPRSRQGQDILRLYTTEHHDEASEAAVSQESYPRSSAEIRGVCGIVVAEDRGSTRMCADTFNRPKDWINFKDLNLPTLDRSLSQRNFRQ